MPERIRGKRLGLITNHAGIDRAGTSDIDLIAAHPDVKLVALFAAEHGIRGVAAAGEKVTDGRDPKSGLPIFSLYLAEDRGPTVEMLKEIDALVYDLPEVGGRTWTYVSTMALSMQAAARKGIPFVVLDRPNPIGGEIVEGALLDPAFKSFVGMYPIPARHGMTVGELATFFNKEFGIGVGADRCAHGELAPRAMVRRHRSSVAESLTESQIAGRLEQLSGHGLLRGDEPDGRPRDRASLRAGGRAMARCACDREHHECTPPERYSFRGHHDGR